MNKEERQSVKWLKTVKEYMTDIQNALDTENYKPNTISYKKEINTFDTVINLIDKQNKMIDFMADWISGSDAIFELPKNIATKEEIKQYFEELLEGE